MQLQPSFQFIFKQIQPLFQFVFLMHDLQQAFFQELQEQFIIKQSTPLRQAQQLRFKQPGARRDLPQFKLFLQRRKPLIIFKLFRKPWLKQQPVFETIRH